MKINCECCDADLDPAEAGAFICSFECTFCEACARGDLRGRCPNCGGGLTPRPIRARHLLARFPAAADRAALNTTCAETLSANARGGTPRPQV